MSAGDRRGDRRRRPGDHALRPALHRRPGADPVPAADLRGAPAPGAAEVADQGRAGRRVRRRPRGAPHRRCCSATAPARSTRTWRWRPRRTCPGTACSATSRPRRRSRTLVYALGKGVLKVMSKMGISTVGSYRAAQVFAVFGIDPDVLDEYFTGTTTRTGGSGLATIAERRAAPARPGLRAEPRAPWSTAASRSAASTSGAARVRSTCSTRKPCTCCSIRPAASRRRSSAGTPRPWTSCPARAARCAGCSSCAPGTRPPVPLDGGGAGRRDRQAVRHRARCRTGRSPWRRTRRWPSR